MAHDETQQELIGLAFAVCDGTAEADQIGRIEELVAYDPDARLLYLQCLELHFQMDRNNGRGQPARLDQEHRPDAFLRSSRRDDSVCEEGLQEPTARAPWPLIDDRSTFLYLHPTSHISISSFVQSYSIAAIVLGVGLLIAWAWKLPDKAEVAHIRRSGTPESRQETRLSVVNVGRITGMVDCQFAKGPGFGGQGSEISKSPKLQNSKSLVSLGDTFALASGLMEITYDTGAKVILQGPVTYEVESKDGGYLSIGKLTARVEKEASEASNPKSEIRSLRSEISKSPNLQISKFVVRTPTATVTDLGTEFGVEVSADRAAAVCVFDGTVDVVQTATAAPFAISNLDKMVRRRLVAGQSLRLEPAGALKSLPAGLLTAVFVRKLPAQRTTTGLERGLVAYWSFDDPANLGKNSVGSGDLAPRGSPAYEAAGVIGGALRVDRDVNKDSLLYNNGQGLPKGVPSGNSSYSISVWCRVDAIPLRGSFDIVGWGEPALSRANALFLYCNASPDKCMVRNYWWDNDNFGIVDMKSVAGGWHHIVSTYEWHGRMQYLYWDGERIGLRAVEQRPDIGANNLAIGHRHLSPGPRLECVGGLVDEVGVWNRELLESEVFRLYNQGKGLNPLATKPVTTVSDSTPNITERAAR